MGKKTYFAESPEVYEQFLTRYALILHDGFHACKRQKTAIFDNLGLKTHVEYPINVHQFLTPTDCLCFS